LSSRLPQNVRERARSARGTTRDTRVRARWLG